MSQATITKVELRTGTSKAGKEWRINYVTFSCGDRAVTAKAWESDNFPVPIEEGKSAELVVKSEGKGDQKELWVKSWGGEPVKQQRGRGSGGGNWQPKSKEEIHASCVAGLIKSALDYCATTGQTEYATVGKYIDLAIVRYSNAIKKLAAGEPISEPSAPVKPGRESAHVPVGVAS